MSIKALQVTATFDAGHPDMLVHAEAFPTLLEQGLSFFSGVTVVVKELGKLKVSGNRPVVRRVLVKIPAVSPADNWQDRQNGSTIGTIVVDPNFKAGAQAIFPSLLDLGTSLDTAISEAPYGLIIAPPPPAPDPYLEFIDAIGPFGQPLKEVRVAGDEVLAGETAAISWTAAITPVAHPITGELGINYNISEKFFPLPKDQTLTVGMTVDGVVWAMSVNTAADTLVLTKDGTPVGTAGTTGTFIGSDRCTLAVKMAFTETGVVIKVVIEQASAASFPATKFIEYFETGTYALATPSSTGSLSFTNNTGATIALGGQIGEFVAIPDSVTPV